MDSHLRHENFIIYHDGYEFVAEEMDRVDGEPFLEIGSQSFDRLAFMIDELWHALGRVGRLADGPVEVPNWYQEHLEAGVSGRVKGDLDVVREIERAAEAHAAADAEIPSTERSMPYQSVEISSIDFLRMTEGPRAGLILHQEKWGLNQPASELLKRMEACGGIAIRDAQSLQIMGVHFQ
jgi:hypothetical protein